MERHASRSLWLCLGLLWLAGMQLRLSLLAVPPVIPLIHQDLHLSEMEVAALTGLPVLLLAAAVLLGSVLIARLGARRTLIVGLFLTALASSLRGVGPSRVVLFGMTFVMGVGIAVFQPTLPSLVSVWVPAQVGLATATYANGLLVGETLSAALTLPVVLPLVGGRWGLAFAVWALPILLTALLLLWLTPGLPDASGQPGVRWWPDWRAPVTWRLGLLLGGSGAAYFGANAFLPDFLHAVGRAPLTAAILALLNVAQLPAPLVIARFPSRLVGRRLPFWVTGAAILVGLGVLLHFGAWGAVLGAALLGFACAFALVLALALPPLLSEPHDVHRLSAGMFMIAYLYSFVVPLAGGAAWDHSHIPATAFLPVVAGAVTMLGAASRLPAGAERDSGWASC